MLGAAPVEGRCEVVSECQSESGGGMSSAKPLDIMLKLMTKGDAAGDDKLALEAAKAAAPYMHGKAATARQSVDLSRMLDDELEAYCRGDKYLFCEEGEEPEEINSD